MNVSMQVPPFFKPITPGLSAEEAEAEALARVEQQSAEHGSAHVGQLVADYHKASEFLASAGVF